MTFIDLIELFHSHVCLSEANELFWSGEEMTNVNPTDSNLKL